MPHLLSLRRGFTLLELLIVVVIITILMALLLPAYQHVSSMGRQATCLANLRKLSGILFAYSSDHNGTMVPCVVYASPTNRNVGTPWINWLIEEGYLKDDGLFPGEVYRSLEKGLLTCPSRETPGSAVYNTMHYGMNYTLGFGPDNENFGYRTPLQLPKRTKVTSPATTLMLAEAKYGYMIKPEARFLNEGPSQNIAFPHRNRMNIIFMDGHAEQSSGPWHVPVITKPKETYPFF